MEIKNILRGADGRIYLITSDGTTKRTDATRLEPIASGADWNEMADEAKKAAADILRYIAREKEAAKEAAENRETCKRIADELDAYACGECVKCPECGSPHYRHDFEEKENKGDKTLYICPDCGGEIDDPDELETLSIYDFFADCLDVEFRIDGNGEYKNIEICIAWGGPAIYIDTAREAVVLKWWGDSAAYALASDTVKAVDEYGSEMWEAKR